MYIHGKQPAGCRDKWKRAMNKRVQETKAFMMKLTDNQLELTTKRAIMENEQMSAELAYQCRQTNAVVQQNQARAHVDQHMCCSADHDQVNMMRSVHVLCR